MNVRRRRADGSLERDTLIELPTRPRPLPDGGVDPVNRALSISLPYSNAVRELDDGLVVTGWFAQDTELAGWKLKLPTFQPGGTPGSTDAGIDAGLDGGVMLPAYRGNAGTALVVLGTDDQPRWARAQEWGAATLVQDIAVTPTGEAFVAGHATLSSSLYANQEQEWDLVVRKLRVQ
jgi:hypothetical protein